MASRHRHLPGFVALGTVLLCAACCSCAQAAGVCLPSELGYQCSMAPCDNLHLHIHWSIGGPAPPHTPSCRYANASASNGTMDAIAALNGQLEGAMLHVAVVARGQHGYVAVSAPKTKRRMTPADAVVGTQSASSNVISVKPYDLVSYQEDSNNEDGSYQLSDVGLVKTQHMFSFCFTRPLGAKGKSQVGWSLDGMPLNFAVGMTDHLARHKHACSIESLSLAAYIPDAATVAAMQQEHELKHGGHDHEHHHHADGEQGDGAGDENDDGVGEWGPLIHGWLMILAWALILPLGMLAPRYRDAVGDLALPCGSSSHHDVDLDGPQHCSATQRWFTVHQVAQWTGSILFLTGMITIFSHEGHEEEDTNAGEASGVMTAHAGIGITILVLLSLHIIIALLRPAPEAVHRAKWRLAHVWGARANILLAAINLLLGPVLYSQHAGDSATATGMYVVMAILFAGVILVAVLLRRKQLALRPTHGKLGATDSEEGHILLPNRPAYSSVAAENQDS